MRIEIATLFVDMCETVLDTSIIGRARRAGKLDIHCRDIRAYTLSKQGRVDDAPYGGGFGLVTVSYTHLSRPKLPVAHRLCRYKRWCRKSWWHFQSPYSAG